MADAQDQLVARITRAVEAALKADGIAAGGAGPVQVHPPAGTCTGDYSKFVELRAKAAGATRSATAPAGLPAATPPPPAAEAAPADVVLAGVITAARLEKLAGVIHLAPGAIVTPLARDLIQARQLRIEATPATGAGTAQAETKKSFSRGEPSMQRLNNVHQIRKEMCDIGHRIWLKGFCAGNEGNHSVRIAEDRVLCTPTGVSKGFLTPDQITVVDMDGKQIDTDNRMKRTSEVLLHLQIYKHRPDVRAVVHSHPPHATAFAMAGIPVPEGIHPEAEVFLGKVPTAKYTTPSYKELGESVVNLVNPDTNSVLLGNHGSVCFDTTLIGAYYKLEILDAYCRILLLTRNLGQVNQLSQQEMVDLLKVKERFGIHDARLACAEKGCVGVDNQPFLATFDPQPASATAAGGGCQCKGGQGEKSKPADTDFEALVQRVTDQIMQTIS
jgi:L-fuculose-phosphate aldolase